jgi:hypothetical protein
MRIDNPAAMPCDNVDKGPEHAWIRRADGTSECLNCGTRLDVKQTADAFPSTGNEIKKKAGAK